MSLFDLIIVQPLFNILIALYGLIPGGDFGLAIIILTIIVRFAMWPIVKKQIHQVKAMRKMAPELKKIKKKAKGNRQMQALMTMELYKQHEINPFRSLLIILIQLPIMIGLFNVIRIFTNNIGKLDYFTYDFVKTIPGVQNLISHPETFNQNFLHVIDITNQAIGHNGVNVFLLILAIGAGYLQYVSSKQTMPKPEGDRKLRDILAEASAGKEADQEEVNAIMMQKMNKIMPVMMVLMMLPLPGALSLYYAATTLVAVIQQKILLDRYDDSSFESGQKKADLEQKSASSRLDKAKDAEVISTTDKQETKAKTSHKKTKTAKTSKSAKPKVRTSVRVVEKGGKK